MSAAEELAPAGLARALDKNRLLHLAEQGWEVAPISRFPTLLRAGDVLVMNDSATLPASLRLEDGTELRLMGQEPGGLLWSAVALGEGDWRTPTENRGFPRRFSEKERLRFAPDFEATIERVSDVSDAWVWLRFDHRDLVAKLCAHARPIQYAYRDHEAPLYEVQTPIAARPWSVEMPSAARPLHWGLLHRIKARGVSVVSLTHGCGISSSGDPRIDRQLPLSEPYEIPRETWNAVARARREGGRVIAVGTSVVRALESASAAVLGGWTELKLGPESALARVDGILTGLHEPGETHFELLRAFLPRASLEQAIEVARTHGLLKHELGDSMLVLRSGQK